MIPRVKGFTKVIILYQRLGNFPSATGCVLVVYIYTVHRILRVHFDALDFLRFTPMI